MLGIRKQAVLPARGFVLPSAVFLLVVLASLAAFLASIAQRQNMISGLDIQGARAYQAARAGVEWGLYQVLDPLHTSVVPVHDALWPNLPVCIGNSQLTIEGFAVALRCEAYPSDSDYYEEVNRQSRLYRLTATASSGVPGSPDFVEREVQATVGKCRMKTSLLPGFECS